MALLFAATLSAQVEDDRGKKMKESQNNAMSEYERFKQQAMQEYNDFRKKANQEYAKFMAEAWKFYPAKEAEEIPWQPKPPEPMVAPEQPAPVQPEGTVKPEEPAPTQPEEVDEPEKPAPTQPVNIDEPEKPAPTQPEDTDVPEETPIKIGSEAPIRLEVKVKPAKPIEKPQPAEPIKPRPLPSTATTQSLYMYGSVFSFHIEKETPLKLKDVTEKSVAEMWTQLSDSKYDNIIAECLQKRKENKLCDWAYVKLTQTVAEKYCGKGTDEAVVMQMYLLTQSGYQMRIARTNSNRLALLMGSEEKIFRYKYFILDKTKFYIIDQAFKDEGMMVFDHAFPKEKSLSLSMTQPVLNVERTEQRTIESDRYPEMKVTVETNRNLLEFYNDCPLTARWDYYSKASMSNVLKKSLYPTLRKVLEGKDELKAANMLLNFVQTGFDYQTDSDQFGYERPLYPDETFFYPYCDCEDRSILFSCLVRELLGLDVVLLNYPNHIATAIHFNKDVKGDAVVIDGKTYIISDPTYINAPVGSCAPKYKSQTPGVVAL